MKLEYLPAMALVLAVALACGSAERSEDEPLSMFSADHKRVFQRKDLETEAFLAGAVKGIVYYNTTLLMEGKPALFCSPTGGLSLDEFWELASAVLKGSHDQDTIVITALNGLHGQYPCPPQQRAAAPISGEGPGSKPSGEETRRSAP
jgi:hypothetical protein